MKKRKTIPKKVQVLVATVNQCDFSLVEKMNIQTSAIIANQANRFSHEQLNYHGRDIEMITTQTRGVGINRNLGLLLSREEILLFADDDVVYMDGYEQIIRDAFYKLPLADVIIFSIDFIKNGLYQKTGHYKKQRVHIYNALKYGTVSVAIRRSVVEKENLHFSNIFGGGTPYGSGEDSLFILDCLRKGLRVYTCPDVIAKTSLDESTWFHGYDEKFFYDKGAWIAAAFPRCKSLMSLYFVVRFIKVSEIPPAKSLKLLKAGIEGYCRLEAYSYPRTNHGR